MAFDQTSQPSGTGINSGVYGVNPSVSPMNPWYQSQMSGNVPGIPSYGTMTPWSAGYGQTPTAFTGYPTNTPGFTGYGLNPTAFTGYNVPTTPNYSAYTGSPITGYNPMLTGVTGYNPMTSFTGINPLLAGVTGVNTPWTTGINPTMPGFSAINPWTAPVNPMLTGVTGFNPLTTGFTGYSPLTASPNGYSTPFTGYATPFTSPFTGVNPLTAGFTGINTLTAGFAGINPLTAAYANVNPLTTGFTGINPLTAGFAGYNTPFTSSVTGINGINPLTSGFTGYNTITPWQTSAITPVVEHIHAQMSWLTNVTQQLLPLSLTNVQQNNHILQTVSALHNLVHNVILPSVVSGSYTQTPFSTAGSWMGTSNVPSNVNNLMTPFSTMPVRDEEIKYLVQNVIDHESRLPRRLDIDVDVKNGIVSLKGTVSNPAVKQLVYAIACQVPGILDVVNDIKLDAATTKRWQEQREQYAKSVGTTANSWQPTPTGKG